MEEARFCIIDPEGRDIAATALPFDALSLGRGVFETVLLIEGRPLFAAEHRQRLAASCEALGIAESAVARRLFDASLQRCAGVPWPLARLRTAVFGSAGASPAALVAVRPTAPLGRPMSLSIAATRRPAGDPFALHKTVDYLPNLLAREKARADGFDDALILDSDGNVAETTTANIFLLAGGQILTPPARGILPGIIRAWVLRTAPSLGIPAAERDVSAAALGDYEAAFVTNSIIGIAPVDRIGAAVFDDARSHPDFSLLVEAYAAVLEHTRAQK